MLSVLSHSTQGLPLCWYQLPRAFVTESPCKQAGPETIVILEQKKDVDWRLNFPPSSENQRKAHQGRQKKDDHASEFFVCPLLFLKL